MAPQGVEGAEVGVIGVLVIVDILDMEVTAKATGPVALVCLIIFTFFELRVP